MIVTSEAIKQSGEMDQEAKKALDRVRDLCTKAYREGYIKGFEAGCAASAGMMPKEPENAA